MSLFGGEGVPFTSQSVTKSWSAVTRRKGRTGDLPYVRQYPAFLTDNLDVLRARSKWLTRNNAHAAGVARDLADQLVGSTGVVPGIEDMTWRRWADDPAQCDHQMRLPLVGMLWAAARAQIVSGEAFVVVRTLRSDSPWPLPLRFDVLDGDALGYGVHAGYGGLGGTAGRVARGARIQQGIEYGASGRRLAYHFHTPSKFYYGDEPTVRVEAVEVFHLYEPLEPGMERGAPWLAPVILKLSDLGAFEEATLKKAEIASQIVAITSRLDGVDASLLPSESDDDALATPYELRVSPGNEVKAMPEQKTAGVKDFADAILSGAAAGVGTVFEDLTGDYRNMPFSAARLSSLKQERRTKGRRQARDRAAGPLDVRLVPAGGRGARPRLAGGRRARLDRAAD